MNSTGRSRRRLKRRRKICRSSNPGRSRSDGIVQNEAKSWSFATAVLVSSSLVAVSRNVAIQTPGWKKLALLARRMVVTLSSARHAKVVHSMVATITLNVISLPGSDQLVSLAQIARAYW